MKSIHHDVWIDSNRRTVFDAISTREGLDSWWGPVLNASPEVGAVVEFDHGHGAPLRMKITDLAIDERLVWECISEFSEPGNPASEWLGTQLIFELQDGKRTGFAPLDSHFTAEPFTILSFRHTGWPDDSRWIAFCNFAWGVTLAGLAGYCSGEGEAKEPS